MNPLIYAAVTGWLVAAGTYAVMNLQRDLAVSGAHKAGKIEGAAEVVAASKKSAEKAHEEARTAHRDARKPGAAQRLFDTACRDCDRPK